MSRLAKLMARKDRCHGLEGQNASSLLKRELAKVNWSEAAFRSHFNSISSESGVAHLKALVEVRFNKKVTVRRGWFEDLADRVGDLMGLDNGINHGSGTFGRKGHNGVAICGPSTVLAGLVLRALLRRPSVWRLD